MSEKLVVAPGARVEIELLARDKTREKLSCVLVNDAAADFAKGLLSVNTPLAQAILGRTAGETLAYAQGDITQIKILSVQSAPPIADADTSREVALRRARDQAELAGMVSFALTFDSKWGAYDPKEIIKQYEAQQTQADKSKGDAP